MQEFVDQNSYTGSQAWAWDSNESRVHYLRILKSGLNANKNGNLAAGVVVANHLLAAADAFRPQHASGEKVGLWNAVPSLSFQNGGPLVVTWSVGF